MRVEEVISSVIMCIVSGLVLVGFTIAWFTNNNLPAVTGMEVMAAEMGSVKVALKSGGEDVSKLTGDARYADIGVAEFTNVDSGELAPGTYGTVTFYLTPTSSSVSACEIVPTVQITQDGENWYPDVTEEDGGNTDNSVSETAVSVENLYQIAKEHIRFFTDETMETEITEDTPWEVIWTLEERLQDNAVEKEVKLFWVWHYEYPFTTDEKASLDQTEQEEYIRAYDIEDMILGNNVSGIKFYFTFSAK